jgi:hypothetical protein
MTQRIAYYQVMYGLPGYMPDSSCAYSWPTRRAMVQSINWILDQYGFPNRARRQIDLVEVWQYIQGKGTKGHFVIRGNHGNLEFVQITEREYYAQIDD